MACRAPRRVETSPTPHRLKLKYDYQYGQRWRVKDANAPATEFWQAHAQDARGQVIDEQLGNGVQTVRGVDAVTGRVDYLLSGPGADGTVQNLAYAWSTRW